VRVEEVLEIVWEGGIAQGFEVGGLWSTSGYPKKGEPAPPLDLWPAGTEIRAWRLHGAGWVAPLWTLRIRSWPQADTWEGLVKLTLERMTAAGASVAWLTNEVGYSDPPSLFEAGAPFAAALSQPTGFVCSNAPGQEWQPLADGTMATLHAYQLSLVDFGLPDPDEP
jgi:hypothetical protein